MHDVSDGGLLVAIAEMALAGGIGVQLFPYEGKLPAHAAWFGEDQGRYVLEAAPELAEEIIERARLLALPARVVGRVGGDALALKGEAALRARRAARRRTRPGCRGTWRSGYVMFAIMFLLHCVSSRMCLHIVAAS